MTVSLTSSLVGSAAVIGSHVWREERLFEVLGRWVPSVVEPEVKLRLAEDSHHHAWHTSLWRDRLPALREMDTEALVAPADRAWPAVLTSLAAAPSTVEKLAALYRVVLPRLVGAYQRHLEGASSVTDGPTIRALELVLADDLNDWRRGEALLQGLLTSADQVQRAAGYQAALETLLVTGN